MKRRRYNRRKRILIAYALRTLVFVILAGMVILMICGGIFIYGLFHRDTAVSGRYEAGDGAEYDGADDVNAEGKKVLGQDGKTGIDSKNDGQITIVLDAGHGGEDCGTYLGEIYEEDINLSVVVCMKELLEERGVNIILTRDKDQTVSLYDRVYIANRTEADLFVSIHCNYYEDDSEIQGLECYYYEGSEKGRAHAENIVEELEEAGNVTVRNAKEGDFYVLRETDIPAVLIELGYLSNTREARKLADHEYQKLLAEGLVESILESL